MARFRQIHTNFWTDSKIVDDFEPDDKYFYLYLLSNDQSNQLGCYELSKRKMSMDTGLDKRTIDELLDRLENDLEVIIFDKKTKEVYVRNWRKYNWHNSRKTLACIEKEFALVKSQKLHNLLSPLYGAYKDLVSNNKNNNKNKNNNTVGANAPATPPFSTVLAFGSEMGMGEEFCKKFFEYYEELGWTKKNGEAIKSWKTVFRNWMKNEKQEESGKRYTPRRKLN